MQKISALKQRNKIPQLPSPTRPFNLGQFETGIPNSFVVGEAGGGVLTCGE
jgi:hypothetical protein